jgi:hypothetical protein
MAILAAIAVATFFYALGARRGWIYPYTASGLFLITYWYYGKLRDYWEDK